MKQLKIYLLSLMAITAMISCEDDTEEINLDVTPSGELMLSPDSGSYEVTEDNQSDLAERFAWNDVDFNLPTEITYQVQMDTINGDYSSNVVLAETVETNAAVTYDQINNAALALEGITGVTDAYKVRVVGAVNDESVETIVSNEVTVSVTPFVGYPFNPLFLVGAATAPGWDNGSGNGGTNPAMFFDLDDSNKYYYTGYFNGDAFKVLSDLGNWQPQYGVRNGAVGVNDGNGSDPDVFNVPSAGYYTFTLDITGVTNDSEGDSEFTIEAFSAGATAPTYTTMGMIGPAVSGDFNGPDVDFTQFTSGGSVFDPHQWVAYDVELTTGEMIIRADDADTNKWGDDSSPYAGQGNNQNDPNISVIEGTYDIYFNDLSGRFVLIPVEDE